MINEQAATEFLLELEPSSQSGAKGCDDDERQPDDKGPINFIDITGDTDCGKESSASGLYETARDQGSDDGAITEKLSSKDDKPNNSISNHKTRTAQDNNISNNNTANEMKAGGDASSSDERKIFIGGLKQDTDHEKIKRNLEVYGPIESVEIIRDRFTGASRGFGFVVCGNLNTCDTILRASIVQIEGVNVEVRKAQPKYKPQTQYIPPASDGGEGDGKVFVGGLCPDMTREELESYFSKFGKVSSCSIVMNRVTNTPRGFAFLSFHDHNEAHAAVGRHPELGRSVEVKLAVPKTPMRPHPYNQFFGRPPAFHAPIMTPHYYAPITHMGPYGTPQRAWMGHGRGHPPPAPIAANPQMPHGGFDTGLYGQMNGGMPMGVDQKAAYGYGAPHNMQNSNKNQPNSGQYGAYGANRGGYAGYGHVL